MVKAKDNSDEIEGAIVNQIVTLEPIAKEGYYLKGWNVYLKSDSTKTINVVDNKFTMPNEPVIVQGIFEPCQTSSGNLVIVNSPLDVSSIQNEIKDEILDNKFSQNNEQTGLIDAIKKDELGITDNDIVVLKIESKIENIENVSGKTVITYSISPNYTINGEEKGKLPNEMLNGNKIKFKLPVPNSITDTYVKVIHTKDGVKIDEKEYKILSDGTDKYIEIETTTFSSFELQFFTPTAEEPEGNPDTSDNVLLYVSLAIITITGIIGTGIYVKKRK